METKKIMLCPNCGSDNVEYKIWYRPNSDEIMWGSTELDENDCWCNDCVEHGMLVEAELKADSKVIGFQVVGKEGTEMEGEIHPDMDASFCLYNRSQAWNMIQQSDELSDYNWKLLAIWEGDIENPVIMFEGNPRD